MLNKVSSQVMISFTSNPSERCHSSLSYHCAFEPCCGDMPNIARTQCGCLTPRMAPLSASYLHQHPYWVISIAPQPLTLHVQLQSLSLGSLAPSAGLHCIMWWGFGPWRGAQEMGDVVCTSRAWQEGSTSLKVCLQWDNGMAVLPSSSAKAFRNRKGLNPVDNLWSQFGISPARTRGSIPSHPTPLSHLLGPICPVSQEPCDSHLLLPGPPAFSESLHPARGFLTFSSC